MCVRVGQPVRHTGTAGRLKVRNRRVAPGLKRRAARSVRSRVLRGRPTLVYVGAMMMPLENRCPRCHAARLRAWGELDEGEREVVRRLPSAADFPFAERAARHLWCVRCWHEEMTGARREA